MRRSDRLALALGVVAALVATLAGVVHTLDGHILDADEVAAQAVRTLTVRTVLNTMNGPTDGKVREAFVAVGTARPENSFVRTRRALVASAADPGVREVVRRSVVAQHASLLAGRTPEQLFLDTTPRRAPFIVAYGPEAEYRTILTAHLSLPPAIRFAHGGWVDAASLTMRASEALAPVFAGLLALLAAVLAGVVLLAESRRAGLRRAGISLLAAAGILYLLFDGLVVIFFRATRSVEAETGGRLFQGLVQSWPGYAAAIAAVGAVLLAGSLAIRR